LVDERAVGLDAVAAEALLAEGPQLLEDVLRHQQRFPTEYREARPSPLERRLHPRQVECVRNVAGVALRILVAVLALDVAFDPERSDLDAHDATFPGCRSRGAPAHRAQRVVRPAVPLT